MTTLTAAGEEILLEGFRRANPEFFKKDDALLFRHLGIVLSLLALSSAGGITAPGFALNAGFGTLSAFFWFSLINVTIHHHHTHRNAAKSEFAKKVLDFLYLISMPSAPKRLNRYTRAHLNHHARPFHETDVDHHYGTERYLAMRGKPLDRVFFFLELTFVGAHVPGWDDDRYMNQVPLEAWSRDGYRQVKAGEIRLARRTALWQWALFGAAAWFLPALAWGWAFPMLLVKNWAHYLGQFQHYDGRLLEANRSAWTRTKTFRVPAWFNYLAGGEISGHFIHHLFPEIPYYRVERARQRFLKDPQLAAVFAIY